MLKTAVRYIRDTYFVKQPETYWLDVSSLCNLRCIMCPQSKELSRPKGVMNYQLFCKTIDEISKNKPLVKLFMSGEPLLNKDVISMIKYAKNKGCKTIMNTNATLLTEDLCRKIIDSGLDHISFSFDGVTKEVYERIRVNADYDAVKNNILRFLKMRKGKTPLVTIEIIRMQETKEEVSRFIEEWKRSNADFLNVTPCMTWVDQVDDHRIANTDTNIFRPCLSIFNSSVILSDGTVVPCCMDVNGMLPMGNINESSFSDIWHGKRYMALRKAHLTNNIPKHMLCFGCCNTRIGTRKELLLHIILKLLNRFRNAEKRLDKTHRTSI